MSPDSPVDAAPTPLLCPQCGESMTRCPDGVRCPACGVRHLLSEGVLVREGGDTYWGALPRTAMQALLDAALSRGADRAVEDAGRDHPWLGAQALGIHHADWRFHLPPQRPGRALVMNSEWGADALALRTEYAEVWSVSPVLEKLRWQALRARSTGAINLVLLQTASLPGCFAAESFDLISLHGVLEWGARTGGDLRAEKVGLLRAVRDLLSPLGCLHVATENRRGLPPPRWRARIRSRESSLAAVFRPHREGRKPVPAPAGPTLSTPSELRALCREAGLGAAQVFWVRPSHGLPNASGDVADPRLWAEYNRARSWSRSGLLARAAGPAAARLARWDGHSLWAPHLMLLAER